MAENHVVVVFPINTKKTFTYQEALELFPLVKRITREAVKKFDTLALRLSYLEPDDPARIPLEEECNQIINNWVQKIFKLGCEVKGLWLVDFNNGEGYYCWRHPEPMLNHFHSYEEGFGGRVPLH